MNLAPTGQLCSPLPDSKWHLWVLTRSLNFGLIWTDWLPQLSSLQYEWFSKRNKAKCPDSPPSVSHQFTIIESTSTQSGIQSEITAGTKTVACIWPHAPVKYDIIEISHLWPLTCLKLQPCSLLSHRFHAVWRKHCASRWSDLILFSVLRHSHSFFLW